MFWIPSQLEGAWVGQDVTIECHSEAYPHSINYWVKKDGVMLLLSKSNIKYNFYHKVNDFKHSVYGIVFTSKLIFMYITDNMKISSSK
jgi:hypothetical protein